MIKRDAKRGLASLRVLPASLGDLARRHGVYPAARALGLEYNKLKRLSGHADRTERATPPPTFVELSVLQPGDMAGCRIELTRPGGST